MVTYATISTWPVQIVNNCLGCLPASFLNVLFATNLTINTASVGTGTNWYFVCGS